MDLSIITDNPEIVAAGVVAILAILRFAFKFTKSTKDDEILEQVADALEDANVIPKDEK